jgi:hypothetical protein
MVLYVGSFVTCYVGIQILCSYAWSEDGCHAGIVGGLRLPKVLKNMI